MRMRANTRQLQASETFKRFDDCFTPTYMVALRGAYIVCSVDCDGLMKGLCGLFCGVLMGAAGCCV